MKLLLFPHSHFCEKARWALDHKRIPYEPVAVFPGLHLYTVRKIAPGSSLPVLVTANAAVQGSEAIIDYLDEHYPERPLTPADAAARERSLVLERQMDAELGVPIRQILYASLLEHPAFIARCFTHSMPRWKRVWYPLVAPVLRKKIYDGYVQSASATAAARTRFDRSMDELATMLDGKRYLVGDTFSRADLAVAALLSLLALPPEHPFPWGAEVPAPAARRFMEDYADHRAVSWVRTIYREHRLAAV